MYQEEFCPFNRGPCTEFCALWMQPVGRKELHCALSITAESLHGIWGKLGEIDHTLGTINATLSKEARP